MITLTEQAKEISEELFNDPDVFIFCNKREAMFSTAKCAGVKYDKYAFAFLNSFRVEDQFIEELIIKMKSYCILHSLRFTEK